MIPVFQFSSDEWKRFSDDMATCSRTNNLVKIFVPVEINGIDLNVPYGIAAKWGLLGKGIALLGEIESGVDEKPVPYFSSRRVTEMWSCKHIDRLETNGEFVPVHQDSIPVGTRGKRWSARKIPAEPDSDDDGIYD